MAPHFPEPVNAGKTSTAFSPHLSVFCCPLPGEVRCLSRRTAVVVLPVLLHVPPIPIIKGLVMTLSAPLKCLESHKSSASAISCQQRRFFGQSMAKKLKAKVNGIISLPLRLFGIRQFFLLKADRWELMAELYALYSPPKLSRMCSQKAQPSAAAASLFTSSR